MSSPNPKPKTYDTEMAFLNAKKDLIGYYQNVSSSQAVRLIAFTAGLFTLLGATQISSEAHFRVIFQDLPSIISCGLTAEGFAIIQFIILFGLLLTLNFFTFRAIFRYVAFAYMANEFVFITRKEIEEMKTSEGNAGLSLHHLMARRMVDRVTNPKNPKKLYGVFSIDNFFSFFGNKKLRIGYFYSFLFSFFSTILLLLVVW